MNVVSLYSGKTFSPAERATLDRFVRYLADASIPRLLEEGMTDEGDEWFVLTDHTGQVRLSVTKERGRLTYAVVWRGLEPRHARGLDQVFEDYIGETYYQAMKEA